MSEKVIKNAKNNGNHFLCGYNMSVCVCVCDMLISVEDETRAYALVAGYSVSLMSLTQGGFIMEIKVYQYWDPNLADEYIVNIQSEFDDWFYMNSNSSPNGVNMVIDPINASNDVQLIWAGDTMAKCNLPTGLTDNINVRIAQIISEEFENEF